MIAVDKSSARCFVLVITAVLMFAFSGQHSAAQATSEVLAPVQRFFDALHRRDKAGLLAECLPQLVVMNLREGKLLQRPIGQLSDLIVSAEPGSSIEEPIYAPVVHVDSNVAVVWAPYKFLVNGKIQHCGTDVITLSQLSGRWTIVALADNARAECK